MAKANFSVYIYVETKKIVENDNASQNSPLIGQILFYRKSLVQTV
jgi:hypothetical protein